MHPWPPASNCTNLNTYDNIMNTMEFNSRIHVTQGILFTIFVLKKKPKLCLGIMKYWIQRILYGVEKLEVVPLAMPEPSKVSRV